MGCCLFIFYKRKRKQTRDVDSLSFCLDVNEPPSKCNKSVSRVSSLINLLPPVRTGSLKRIRQNLQCSISFRGVSRTEAPPPSVRAETKRRDSKLWTETFDVQQGGETLSAREIRRQEAMFELAQGEQDLVEDLQLAKKAYRDPMLKLSIMSEDELNQIFGSIDSLIPLHEDLLRWLEEARRADGCTEHVGLTLTHWLPCLQAYTAYCCNQVAAKALLDRRQRDTRVHDFLQRCLLSPFSRKLDLWNFLDIPRSRLVKYPLLLREILKHTPSEHADRPLLEEAKLHVFLFQDVLVITRCLSLGDHPISFQLCQQPIPVRQLELEDISDGAVRMGGSLRGAFSNTERSKNFFRVSWRSRGGEVQTHCFQASEAFNKQQWMNSIRQAKEAAGRAEPSGRGQEGSGEEGEEGGHDGETGGGQVGLLSCSSPREEEEMMEAEPPGGRSWTRAGWIPVTSLPSGGGAHPALLTSGRSSKTPPGHTSSQLQPY